MLVTAQDAAEILNVEVQSVYMMASRGRLVRHAPGYVRKAYDLHELEEFSLAHLKYTASGHPYWLTVSEVAELLGVVPSRVRMLMEKGKVPFVMAPNRRRYVRRPQLEVIANARAARAGRFP